MDKLDILRRKKAMLAAASEAASAAKRVPGVLARRQENKGDTSSQTPASPPARQQSLVVLDPVELKRRRKLMTGEHGLEYDEINRITSLPIVEALTPDQVEAFNKSHLLSSAYLNNFRLWELQCRAVKSYEDVGGLFGAIGVGWGKTMITQLIATAAFTRGVRKIMLLVPPALVHQLMRSMFPFARKRIPIPYPVHVMADKSAAARRQLAKSGKKGLYVMPYSLLSTKDSTMLLESIAPELIIADEADALGNRRAARTKRFMSYVRDYDPQGCVLSGTITSKSISDYWHLIKWCLKKNCPLPLSSNLASEWATKIDAQASSSDATGPILPLVEWVVENFPGLEITEDTAGFRLAYKERLRTCPGVVSSGDADIGPSLIMHNEPVKAPAEAEGWERLEQLRLQVVNSWLTPNGDEIEHAIHTYKWLYELSAGFYNELTFPSPEALAEREEVELGAAEEFLELARETHRSQQLYHSALRAWIDACGSAQLDTPLLVGLDMSKNGPAHVGHRLYELWQDYKGLEETLGELALALGVHKGGHRELQKKLQRAFRDSRVVRVCPYKIDHAVEWAKSLPKGKGALVWVWNQGIGRWATEALQEAGLNPLYCPAGDTYNDLILDPKNEKRVIVASMRAHGVGKNLQAFDRQLFLQWPRSAKIAEQTLGRTHRNGQRSAEVWACTNTTSDFDQLCFAATLNDSLYVHQTTGNRQKLIYATYSPGLPKVFPSAVLRERGFQNRRLTKAQEDILLENFGNA